jgi:Protein of unknown function (DUF3024)
LALPSRGAAENRPAAGGGPQLLDVIACRIIPRVLMAFSSFELKGIEKLVGRLCRRRSVTWESTGTRLEYEVVGHRVIVIETRPIWNAPSAQWSRLPVAKLSFVRKAALWYLLWPRTSRRWTRYGPLPCSRDLPALVAEIDRDPHCCFFG